MYVQPQQSFVYLFLWIGLNTFKMNNCVNGIMQQPTCILAKSSSSLSSMRLIGPYSSNLNKFRIKSKREDRIKEMLIFMREVTNTDYFVRPFASLWIIEKNP